MKSSESTSNQPLAEAPTAEEYKELEGTIAAKRAELATVSVDDMPALVAEIQSLEGKRLDSIDAAYDEAKVENDEIDADAVFEEAQVENRRRDEEAKEGERIQQIDKEIATERQKLSNASVDDLSNVVARIRELEMSKTQSLEDVNDEAAPEAGSEESAGISESEPDLPGKEVGMPEEELNSRMDEIFELNRQIKNSGKWYEEGVIPAHEIEKIVDSEIGSTLGLPEGSEVTATSFSGSAELLKISEEIDALPNSARTYSFYDSLLPDILKRIQEMDLTLAQKFGPLGKLKKTLGASPNVENLFKTLDAARPSYEEWKRLQEVRDEKIKEIEGDVSLQEGTDSKAANRSLAGYVGTAEEWRTKSKAA